MPLSEGGGSASEASGSERSRSRSAGARDRERAASSARSEADILKGKRPNGTGANRPVNSVWPLRVALFCCWVWSCVAPGWGAWSALQTSATYLYH